MVEVVEKKEEFPQEVIDDLRKTKVPCPKCAGQVVIFEDTKPRFENVQGQTTVVDYMRCLGCSAMYTQYYY